MPVSVGPEPGEMFNVSRRRMLASGATAAVAVPLAGIARTKAEATPSASVTPAGSVAMDIVVNGQNHHLALDPRTTLLDALRDHIGLTGSKKGCDHGQYGSCRRQARAVLPDLGGGGAPAGYDHRGTYRTGRPPPSDATGLYRYRCIPVRLLHARSDYVGDRLRQRRSCRQQRGDRRIYER